MGKKAILIFTIITSLLSLTVILLTYFGIIRYWSLKHTGKCEKYIEKYKKVDYDTKEKRIVVGIHSEIERSSSMQPTINSIFDQTRKVNFLNIICNLEVQKDLPKFMQRFTNICPLKVDYGTWGNTMVPMLIKEPYANSLQLALKDNIIYGKDFLELLLKEIEKNPKKVITDPKRTFLAFRSSNFGTEWLENPPKSYNMDYFLKNARDGFHIFKYRENYQYRK